MKAIDVIKGFCTTWNNCENCNYVTVPDYKTEEEYRLWCMDYYGFVPEGLKPGAFYLVVWGEEEFHDGKGYVHPDSSVDYEGDTCRFYEII